MSLRCIALSTEKSCYKSKVCSKSNRCFTQTIFMVYSDTSSGFWTLDLLTYVISAYSNLCDGKFFEFEILNKIWNSWNSWNLKFFHLGNLKYTNSLGNGKEHTPLFFTVLHWKTTSTPFLLIILQGMWWFQHVICKSCHSYLNCWWPSTKYSWTLTVQ